MSYCPQCGYPAPCGRCDYAETEWERIFAGAGQKCAAFVGHDQRCNRRVAGRSIFCAFHQAQFVERNAKAL
jgi:hypothetical protein